MITLQGLLISYAIGFILAIPIFFFFVKPHGTLAEYALFAICSSTVGVLLELITKGKV
jgi:hypothetical protein